MDPRGSSIGRRGDGADTLPSPPRNLILARLPDEELAAFMDEAKTASYPLREVFFEEGDPIESVYFPLTGMCSLVTMLEDGTSLEAMTVGREGFVGLPLINGVTTHRSKGICQIEGEFALMPANSFLQLLESAPRLTTMLRRYSQFAYEVVTQSAACNGTHRIEQRCARWLLTTADAVGRTKFTLTQEFLSQMLGVRRAGVTVAIGALERRSLISHRYGNVEILDLEGLKTASCECYRTVSRKARELLLEGASEGLNVGR